MAGIDNNTILMLHGEEIVDNSLNPKTINNVGVTVNENGKFGKGLNLGSNQCLKITNGMQGVDLAGDFTIEWWEYSTGTSTSGAILTNRIALSSSYCYGLLIGFKGTNLFMGNSTSTWNGFNGVTIKDKVNDIWVHWRLVKKGTLWTSYKNGIKFWSATTNASPGKTDGDNCTIGAWVDNSNVDTGYNAIIDEFKICNYALCDGDFEVPTKPYNSIKINILSQTATNINFSVIKLGQETINKVEVLINGTVSETYTDNYDNINYLIDTELCTIGNNDITIRVTYDDNYTEEKVITYKQVTPPLPLETPLLDTVERVKLLTKSKQNEKDMLSSILTSKNVEVLEEDKMSDLIGKVDLLGDAPPPPLYLYKDGDECTDVTGGWGHSYLYNASYNITETPILQKNSDHIYMEQHQGSTAMGQRSAITTKNSISLSNYSKLLVEVSINSAYDNIFMVRSNYLEGKQSNLGDSIINFVIKDANVTNKIYKLDITSVSSGYIQYQLHTVGGTKSTKIHKIWLEK